MPAGKEVEPLRHLEVMVQRDAPGDLGLEVLPAHPHQGRDLDPIDVRFRRAHLPVGIVIRMLHHLLDIVVWGRAFALTSHSLSPQPIRAFMPTVDSAG